MPDPIQSAHRLATAVFDALTEPDNIDVTALTRTANNYLDNVKETTPPILAKARAVAMAVIDLNLMPETLGNLKRASRELEAERIGT